MQEIIIDMINQFGYAGVFLLILIETIFPPIPSEVILLLTGFMTTYSNMNLWLVILFATAGAVLGAILLYVLGRVLSIERLERIFASKLGRLLRLKKEDVRKAESWFLKRGGKAVFFCRFIPIVRSLISIPAGMAKMKFGFFLLLTTIGTAIWNTVLVFLGRFAGDTWQVFAEYFDTYTTIAIVVFAVIAVVVAAVFIKKRFLSGGKQEESGETEDQSDTDSE